MTVFPILEVDPHPEQKHQWRGVKIVLHAASFEISAICLPRDLTINCQIRGDGKVKTAGHAEGEGGRERHGFIAQPGSIAEGMHIYAGS